ncbi:flavin reductase family protein [Urechidicola vernalis]|uniref:Flavin reductase family protein n=1 Tax=Urechidicola vernalis TaxID=3075600 RepID=A0ABU2Y4A1_9FLAO|nr:flavin reductase family protein [Urechidicola sp. P050]MDT0553012.1 flavin reductase family protein [Urechidicola sp. P050]
MISVKPKDLSTKQLHGYLLGAVTPRPIAFASTIDKDGNPNLSPFSFFNVFSAKPPILVFSPARRVRDNTIKHTLINAKETKEVVINIVNHKIVQQMSLSSTEYPDGVNEFDKSGLTMLQSDVVKPFRVKESPVQIECKINEIVELGNEGGAGNLIICEVVKLHIDETILDENGAIDQFKIDTVARMGGNWYTRANQGMFEIAKPLTTLGVGVDAIPATIRNSKVLTGNDLGMLGNVECLPNEQNVDKFAQEHPEFIGVEIVKKHTFAQEYIKNNDVESAWKVLLMN